MENRKLVKAFAAFLLTFGIVSQAFGYSVETHAFLTAEAVRFYNKNFPQSPVAGELGNFIIDGARKEDDAPRWMNHFYDPVHDRGLTDNVLGNWQKSKDWARDQTNQNRPTYKVPTLIASILTAVQQKNIEALTLETDFTWQKAIDFYAEGETEKALFSLGHVLHLVEDAAVPEHTRNDPHPGDSPYEDYTRQFNLNNPDSGLVGRLAKKTPFIFGDLSSYFKELAAYTNSHFYSKDTIGIQSGYQIPIPFDYDNSSGKSIFSLNRDEDGFFKLSIQPVKSSVLVGISGEIIIDDSRVLLDYWQRLSVKAVQYSAGTINLFFEEAEKAKKEYEFSKKQEEEKLKASFVEVLRAQVFEVIHAWDQAARAEASGDSPTIYLLPAEARLAAAAIINNIPQETVQEENPDISEDEEIVEEISPAAGIRGTIDLLSTVREAESRKAAAIENSGIAAPVLTLREQQLAVMTIPSGGGGGGTENQSSAVESESGNSTTTEENSGNNSNATSTATSTPESTPDPVTEPEPEPEPEPAPVIPNQAPTAIFSFLPADPALGDTIDFNASSSTDSDGEIISYSWDFGDGNASNSSSSLISYDYAATGTFAVVLTAIDDDGASDTVSANIVIAAPRVSVADHAVISEILFDPVGNDSKKEFVELYNPTNEVINTEDWELRYQRANGTTARLALFNNRNDQTLIAAKGFLLVGLNNYDKDNYGGRSADIKRNNDLLNGRRNNQPETIRVYLLNADEEEVDDMSYDENSISAEGQSLERLAWQSGYCADSQNGGEFIGNGCDRNSGEDWQIRNQPNPQNSGNLPEPRRAPTIVNSFSTIYQAFPRPELRLSWDWSIDYNNATSSLSYEIRELDYGSSTPLNFNSTATSVAQFIDEVGRNFRFSIRAVDAEGYGSATTTAQVSAPGFASAINFFRNPNATSSAYAEIYYDQYPFIPKSWLYHQNAWNVSIFYLNREAPKIANLGHSWSGYGSSTLAFNYQGCGADQSGPVIVWPESRDHCNYDWGTPRRLALNWDAYLDEDSHLLLGTNANNPVFQAGDYLTAAFYSYDGSNGQALVAVDKNRYFFQEEMPGHQSPVFAAGDLNFDFNETTSRLTVSAPAASDSDTLDSAIVYELRIATSSEALAAAAPINSAGYSFYAAAGHNYFFNLKARDDLGNYADRELSGQWSYPIQEIVLNQEEIGDSSGGWGGVPNDCNYGMANCYDSRSVQSLFFATDTVFRIANAVLARGSGNDAPVIVLDIYADSGNNPDFGTVLASAQLTGFNALSATEVSFVFGEPFVLAADQRYWLGLRVAEYGGDGNSRFHFNSFTNALAVNGDGIVDGEAGYRPSGSASVNHQADRDWFLKLFR